MKLLKGTIRPGIVLEVFNNGNIKASAPGLFSYSDDIEKLPEIMPWQIGSNCNSFSKPLQYDNVWIMNFEDNPQQLYWFRKDRVQNNENISLEYEVVEVICNRDVAGEWCTIYFSDGSGWIIGKGESIIQIRPDGSILLKSNMPNRSIDINGNCISIGSEGESAHPAAYGDSTEDALLVIMSILSNIQRNATLNPYTVNISTAILPLLPTLQDKISKISSSHVTID